MLPCPSLSPGACSNSCPWSQWFHPTIYSFCHPLLLLPSIFPNIRVFPNESVLHISGQSIGTSTSESLLPMNKYSGLISFRMKWFDLLIPWTYLSLPLFNHKGFDLGQPEYSILKSDWLYSLQPKMEKLYTVSKNKTGSWLWLRSWTPYCQIQT